MLLYSYFSMYLLWTRTFTYITRIQLITFRTFNTDVILLSNKSSHSNFPVVQVIAFLAHIPTLPTLLNPGSSSAYGSHLSSLLSPGTIPQLFFVFHALTFLSIGYLIYIMSLSLHFSDCFLMIWFKLCVFDRSVSLLNKEEKPKNRINSFINFKVVLDFYLMRKNS